VKIVNLLPTALVVIGALLNFFSRVSASTAGVLRHGKGGGQAGGHEDGDKEATLWRDFFRTRHYLHPGFIYTASLDTR